MDETQYSQLAGLLGLDPEKLRQQQQMQGLLSAGLNILAASGPSAQPRSLGQILAQGGTAGMQAYQQAGQQAIETGVQGLKIAEIKKKFDDEQKIRSLSTKLYTPEGGVDQTVLRQISAIDPTRAKSISELETGQSEIINYYDAQGREAKARYNKLSQEITPIGGAKAETFIQIDRGNVIELRRPSGEVIGTLPKGAAPVAPSYTMTETGQILNTKTGQLVQPRDEQGNVVAVDTTIKASEDERKSAGFFTRMKDATTTINSPLTDQQGKPVLDKQGNPITIANAGSKPEMFAEIVGGLIPNWMGGQAAQNMATSAVRQQYQQAQENWVSANLRAESGAAIGIDEMRKEIKKYFPQVGDSDAVIKQKEEARKVAEDSMRQRAGRAISTKPRNVNVNY